MSPSEFVYWLQGWVEMEQAKKPNLEQWKMITNHLSHVFTKLTPTMDELLLEDDGEGEASFHDALEEFIEDLNADPSILFDTPTPPNQFVPGQPPYPIQPGDEGHFPGPKICGGIEPDLSKTQYCCSSDSTPKEDWEQPRVLPK